MSRTRGRAAHEFPRGCRGVVLRAPCGVFALLLATVMVMAGARAAGGSEDASREVKVRGGRATIHDRSSIRAVRSRSHTAYVTLVSGGSASTIGYAIGALALAESIASGDPLRRRIALVTPDTLPDAKLVLLESGMWDVVEISPPNWKRLQLEFNLSGVQPGKDRAARMKKIGTFTKLRIFDQHVKELAKLQSFLFVDADAFVRNADELAAEVFDRPGHLSQGKFPIAAVQNIPIPRCALVPRADKEGDEQNQSGGGQTREVCFSNEKEFNTGVLHVIPGPALYGGLGGLALYDKIFRSPQAPHLPWDTWDTDQAVLNSLLLEYYDKVTTLPYRLNTLMCCAQQDERLREAAGKAVIAHFSVSPWLKPWEMMRYKLLVKLGRKSVEGDYLPLNVVPWFLEHSVLYAVYMEWHALAVRGMRRLGVSGIAAVEGYLLRDRDFLDDFVSAD